MKKSWIVVFGAILHAHIVHCQQQPMRIGVLGLFHPRDVVVSPVHEATLHCAAGEDRWAIREQLRVALDGKMMTILNSGRSAKTVACDDGAGGPVEFVATVPEKLSRHYVGTLTIEAKERELIVIVTMELETAVASIVAAESPPRAPMEALKAQAVATRSFLVAGRGRHAEFDFCDTTHCQFLRQPPESGHPAFHAAEATRGLVLAYRGQSFAAMYSASCGGRTHSLAELGIIARGYPYYGVDCRYCHQHPQKWVSRIGAADAAGLAPTEASRLQLARKLGWKAVPGNSYSSRSEGDDVILEGTGAGHGIGLCQRGGAEMARQGATFQQILEHYYPNTEVRPY
jgi:stage II sporulation SpoD-like protein